MGTITEVYDYLRLLYARIGMPHCPTHGVPVTRQTPQQIVDRVLQLPEGTRFQVLAPVVRGRKGTYETLLADLAAQGFARAIVDGELHELTEPIELARYEQHTIEVVVDRLVRREGIDRRLTDSLETALKLADGVAEVQIVPRNDDGDAAAEERHTFSQHMACPVDGESFEELAPRNFSFNSPYGACPRCDGLGTRFEVDPELVVPNPEATVDDGAIAPWSGGRSPYFTRLVEAVCDEHDIDRGTPWEKLTARNKKVLLYGAGNRVNVSYKNRYGRTRSYHATYEGVIPWLERRYADSESDSQREQIEGYMREVPCPECHGARLKPLSLAVTVDGRNIAELCMLSIGESAKVLDNLDLSERDRMIAERVVKEVNARMGFLLDVGLDYLTLSTVGRHPGRRRGPAHPAGVPDRQRAGRRAVRARRAVDRPPPARQPPADRDAAAAARPGQHGDGRRARRGHDPGRRPRGRHRSRRRRARRLGRRTPGASPVCSRAAARSPGSTCRGSARSRSPASAASATATG